MNHGQLIHRAVTCLGRDHQFSVEFGSPAAAVPELSGLRDSLYGITDHDSRRVTIKRGLDDETTLLVLIHEFVHATRHSPALVGDLRTMTEAEVTPIKTRCECEAELATLLVATVLKLDVDQVRHGLSPVQDLIATGFLDLRVRETASPGALAAARQVIAALTAV